MLNEIKIRCFLDVAQTLSFTRTAKRLYITQQGVSKHITNLEKEVGCRLFVRRYHQLLLTREGERLRDIFTGFLGAYDGFCADHSRDRQERTIRLGYLMGIDFGVEPIHAVEQWKKENAGASVFTQRCEVDELERLLSAGELDIIFCIERFRPEIDGIHQIRLRPVRMELLVSSVNPKASDEATYLDFIDEPMITENFASESHVDSIARVKKDAADMGIRPRRFITVPNRESAFAAAENGVGICVAPQNSWNAASRHLRGYPLPYNDQLVCLWLDTDKSRRIERYTALLAQAYGAR